MLLVTKLKLHSVTYSSAKISKIIALILQSVVDKIRKSEAAGWTPASRLHHLSWLFICLGYVSRKCCADGSVCGAGREREKSERYAEKVRK